MCNFSLKSFIHAYQYMMLDTIIGPIDADLTWQGMDPTFCDSDLDYASEAASNSSGINFASDDDDFDSDDDNLDSSDHHPGLEQRSNNESINSSLPNVELECVSPDEDDAAVTASAADPPEVIQRLRKQLLAGCHDPSHGGFYMAKGAFYIRIGLPPRVVSGDCLVLSHYGLTVHSLHCRCAYPMSGDWGCTSTCCRSLYVPISSMRPWGLYLHSHVRPLSW